MRFVHPPFASSPLASEKHMGQAHRNPVRTVNSTHTHALFLSFQTSPRSARGSAVTNPSPSYLAATRSPLPDLAALVRRRHVYP